MRRPAVRVFAVLTVLVIALLVTAWMTRRAWALGMLVMPPSPTGVPCERPQAVSRSLVVQRDQATIRSWVLEPEGPVRGTLFLLHGIRSSKQHMMSGARWHASRGFRVLAVDSRGHGESSGPYLTYGVEEARDLVAVADAVEQRGLLAQPFAVVGSSYGAATALQYAAIDGRVRKVVAESSFASLREVVPAYLAWILGPVAQLIPGVLVDDLIDGAAARAGFDADDACPRCVAPRIKASVLLVHSRDDERIPWRQCLQIRDALKAPAEVLLVQGARHVGTGGHPAVAPAVERWLDAP